MNEIPELSVIIVSYNAINTIEYCLKSLERQRTKRNFEIIVVDSSTDGTGKWVEKHYPRVRVYRYRERKFPGDARNIGISLAKAEIIAFVDADCLAEQNWIDQILEAHKSQHPVIGGAVGNANPKSYVGWAAYFCEFSQWMPGSRPKWLPDIPTANISYKKEIFHTYGGFIEGTYCSDTDLHWRLGEDGHRLRFIPSILVSHNNINRFRIFLTHEFFHGRSFAKVRVRSQGFSRWKRLAYVILAPLIPLKLLLEKILINMTNRIYFTQFLKSSPLLALGIICWSLGEMDGYLRG